MSDDENLHDAINKLIRGLSVVIWFYDMKTRVKMAWACIRGRSVCYRMKITPDGTTPLTDHAFVVDSQFIGNWNGGTALHVPLDFWKT